MIRSATAELCGSLAQQQQQQQEFRRLRQQLQDDQRDLREQLQQTAPQSPHRVPQGATPYLDLSARQTDLSARQAEQHGLIKSLQQKVDEWRHLMDQSLALQQRQPELTTQPQSSALEAISSLRAELAGQQETLAELRQELAELHKTAQPLGDEVRGRMFEATRQLNEHKDRFGDEVSTLRQDVATLRTEVTSFASELDTVQTSVVMRVGEVCSQTLQEWKESRAEGLTRLEGRVSSLQETTSNLSGELHRRVAQLLSELKLEREDRCKSVADLHVQCVQLNVAASEANQNYKSQSSQLGVVARAVECLQLQCKALPVNFAMLEVNSASSSPNLRP